MSIVLDALHKRFGSLVVVDRVSLEVADGELFVLLGTSGSGKSTVLRMIAGLVAPDSGRISLHGRDVTHVPPQQRGTGFVFQNYSIFRHMSVAENIEFGLRIRGVAAEERARRREELLELVGMAGLGARYADQLSGGQQQRVALARALAYQPSVLLLDEPFGALDVKTRAQLRRALKDVQHTLRVTSILVTHDQDEAFELADRIGVLDRGRLIEVAQPEALYATPRTSFAAMFVGAGTVLVGRVRGGRARLGPVELPLPPGTRHEEGAAIQVLFRPEHVALGNAPPDDDLPVLGKGRIIENSFAGPLRRVRVRLPRLPGTRQAAPTPAFGEEALVVDAAVRVDAPLDDEVWVWLQRWHLLGRAEPRILAIDVGQVTTAVLQSAAWVAERYEAAITVLGVAADAGAQEALRDTLQQHAQDAQLERAEVRVRTGDLIEQVSTELNESLYDFIIVETGRDEAATPPLEDADVSTRTMLRLRRVGSLVPELLARAHMPIMIVKGNRPVVHRMLICTAVGEPGKQDIRVGGLLARRFGAYVTLLHVNTKEGEERTYTRQHLDRAVNTLLALEVPVHVRVRKARFPARGILDEAREGDHDLIVLGGSMPAAQGRAPTTDVALQVMLGADRPVLVVPYERE
jgi:sulfate transport system ATP-binding protein